MKQEDNAQMNDLIEKVKQGLRCIAQIGECDCDYCDYADNGHPSALYKCQEKFASDALSVIEDQQAEIERLQPKVAKWITVRYLPQDIEFKRCTCCDYLCMGWDGETGVEYDYCPNCGAKMD